MQPYCSGHNSIKRMQRGFNYHCMVKAKAAMDQFLRGLEMGGVAEYILRLCSTEVYNIL